jgi:hypothetical protein
MPQVQPAADAAALRSRFLRVVATTAALWGLAVRATAPAAAEAPRLRRLQIAGGSASPAR